jgi:hypothetical protein
MSLASQWSGLQAVGSQPSVVHGFWSSQEIAGFEHWPVAGSQAPAWWHASRAEQVTGLPPTQFPATQVSVFVHALPSLQGEPSVRLGLEQTPVAVLHVPTTWHWSSAVQTTGLFPTQLPLWQLSVFVQAFPSSHEVPSAFAGLEQTPVAGLHAPAT